MRLSVAWALAVVTASSVFAQGYWPRWRGPDGGGQSPETGIPMKWDASAIAWKTPLPGKGQSSPVIWGERIFLTTALEDGKQRVVLCVNRADGKVAWQHTAWTGTPEPTHKMNGWASATCCADADVVVASFGMAGLHCYTHEGKHLWSKDLGKFLSKNKRGTAACPLIVGDVIVQNGDSDSDPFLFGVDKKTGNVLWKTPRPATEGYSSPIVMQTNGRTEVVLNGHYSVCGYDAASGKMLWSCKAFAGRGEPSPAPGKDIVYVVNGLAGDVYAVKTGGAGDVTKSHMTWHTPRKGGRDQPSPVVVGGQVLVANMGGVCTAYSAADGKEVWKERLHDGQYTASPVAADGKAYFLNEAGDTVVVEPGPKMKVVSINRIGGAAGELFRASPAICQGQIFLRSDQVLYCIGKLVK